MDGTTGKDGEVVDKIEVDGLAGNALKEGTSDAEALTATYVRTDKIR